MKRIVILLALITSLAYGQEQNFLEKPYYRTQVNADTLVVPDKIYLQIALSEKDSREKKSTEELYNKIEEYNSQIQLVVIIAIAVVAVIAVIWWQMRKRKKRKANASSVTEGSTNNDDE